MVRVHNPNGALNPTVLMAWSARVLGLMLAVLGTVSKSCSAAHES
jgi:hypothetical protein